jgi:hypothetical protein
MRLTPKFKTKKQQADIHFNQNIKWRKKKAVSFDAHGKIRTHIRGFEREA